MAVKILNVIKTIAVIYALTAIILLVLTFGVYKFGIAEWQVNAGIILAYVISCAAGGFIIGSKQKSKRILWGMLIGVFYFTILAVSSLLTGDFDEINIREMIKTLVICLAAGSAGSFFSS